MNGTLPLSVAVAAVVVVVAAAAAGSVVAVVALVVAEAGCSVVAVAAAAVVLELQATKTTNKHEGRLTSSLVTILQKDVASDVFCNK